MTASPSGNSSERYGTFQRDLESYVEKQRASWKRQRGTRWRQRWSTRLLLGGAVTLAVVVAVFVSIDIVRTTTKTNTSTKSIEGGVQTIYVYTNASGRVDVTFSNTVEEGYTADADAWAFFNDSLHSIGWSQLWVQTAQLLPDEANSSTLLRQRRKEIYYAAGYAEGALTHHRMDQHYQNVFSTFFPNDDPKTKETLAGVQQFLRENIEWMETQVEHYAAHPDLPEATYWDVMGDLLAQFHGLVDGYQRFSESKSPASEVDWFMISSDGDLEDIIPIIQLRQQNRMQVDWTTESFYKFLKNMRCSALIRILPGFSDLLVGHATWDVYASMNRIFKHHEFPLSTGNDRRKISMSSSPGFLTSLDDWYITNAGLSVMETTNGVFNNALYELVTPNSVLCWLRAKVATFLAADGPSWVSIFSKYNSGTYNNQWMITNTNKFTRGSGFQPGGLTVLEQLPGYIRAMDVSSIVNAQGYWASYNVPYFPRIYEQSGYLAAYLASNESTSWSHENCSRAKIFQRDAPTIESFDDFKRLMRYNDWEHDILSEGHASYAIASRFDLERDPSLFGLIGAIDAKAATLEKLQRLECDAIMGPTHDRVPVFEWTEQFAAKSAHFGHPARFDFQYERMRHEWS